MRNPSDMRAQSDPLGESTQGASLAFRLGAILQGTVLGSLLAVAICQLIIVAGDVQIFRYQGF